VFGVGYLVAPSGRLHLPAEDDAAATTAVKAEMLIRPGWFSGADSEPGETLADVAWAAGAAVTRVGDWIEFGHDDEGDPKWSGQATAFYVALAPYVLSGRVDIEGEDGGSWSYSYDAGLIAQHGWNGWDGSVEPFGEPVEFPYADSE
jgi:hypothetical protein